MMKYKGVTLILDNFREVLKGFSVDIQDIVRSAILDGVDIEEYINRCKNNPYKLDQIRLALKEGVSSKYYSTSGQVLYKIRHLKQSMGSLSSLDKYMELNLTDEHYKYLIEWIEMGVNLSNIDVSIIPESLLPVFGSGFSYGVDMSEFNTGKNFSPKYVMDCIKILKCNQSVSVLLQEEFSGELLELLCKYANMLNTQQWGLLLANLNPDEEISRAHLLIRCCVSNMAISKLQSVNSNHEYVYDEAMLSVLLEGYKNSVNIEVLMKESTATLMKKRMSEMLLKRGKKISGRVIKR